MSRHVAIALLFMLAACQRFEDTGRACVLPEQLDCHISFGDSEGDTGIEYDNCTVNLDVCICRGYYPADQAYQVQARMSDGGGGYAVKSKCRVEMDGDHELSVKASYWHEPERDAIVEPAAVATCPTPVLTAGDWTLRYGEGEVVFRVGDDEQQEIACAFGDF